MSLKPLVKRVEQSKVFKSFIKKHPDYFLVHCFTMLSEGEKKPKWELGYYSEKTDKLVVFETEPDINMRPPEDAFKQQGTIQKLELGQVKASLSTALKRCDELLKSKYQKQSITQKIIILQNLDKQIYNITMVSRSFEILNIKIDSATGELLSDNIQSIMNLGKQEK